MTITRATPFSELPEFLSVEEAAAVLHVGRAAVYTLVNKGKLPSVRIGRFVRVTRDGLIAMRDAANAGRVA